MEPDRFAYSPITTRPKLVWPNGARVALWVSPNFEHYEYVPKQVRVKEPWPRTPYPDVLGYGIRDYGNRVGAWRFFEVMDRHDIRCTVSISMSVLDHYPEIFEACEERHWDYLCHGIYNTRYMWDLSEQEERDVINNCIETFHRVTGRKLAGWFGPACSFTLNSPDLVAEAGFKYCTDWYHDDQPFPMKVRTGNLITVPYSMEINDAIEYRHATEGKYFAQMIKDNFDTLYREGADSGRVMGISLHPYMMGQPHRIKHLDEALSYILSHDGVWKTTGEEIADWYIANCLPELQAHLDGEL
jgi:allantoinase